MPPIDPQLQRRIDATIRQLITTDGEDRIREEYYMVLTGIVESAAVYWDYPGAAEDFCIQHIAEECIVFGGWNRLFYHPGRGFSPDRSYCSPQFLAHYDTIGRLPTLPRKEVS